MAGAKLRRCAGDGTAPVIKRQGCEFDLAFIRARQVGQQAVNPCLIQPAHDVDSQAAEPVAFIKQGRDNQQALGPIAVAA
jgi:hypothetical protein